MRQASDIPAFFRSFLVTAQISIAARQGKSTLNIDHDPEKACPRT
jgi:hypothetical protein